MLAHPKVISSPYIRTRETTSHFLNTLSAEAGLDVQLLKVAFHPELVPDGPLLDAANLILNTSEDHSHSTLVVVTHQPIISRLRDYLIDGVTASSFSSSASSAPLMPASMLCLQGDAAGGGCCTIKLEVHPYTNNHRFLLQTQLSGGAKPDPTRDAATSKNTRRRAPVQ